MHSCRYILGCRYHLQLEARFETTDCTVSCCVIAGKKDKCPGLERPALCRSVPTFQAPMQETQQPIPCRRDPRNHICLRRPPIHKQPEDLRVANTDGFSSTTWPCSCCSHRAQPEARHRLSEKGPDPRPAGGYVGRI